MLFNNSRILLPRLGCSRPLCSTTLTTLADLQYRLTKLKQNIHFGGVEFLKKLQCCVGGGGGGWAGVFQDSWSFN